MGRTNFPDGVNVGNEGTGTAELSLGGTAVTATAAQLNTLAGALGATAVTYDSATKRVLNSGSTALTAGGTISTGLAGTARIIACLDALGTGSFAVSANGDTAGSAIFTIYNSSAAAATVLGTVHWLAIGTAA